MRRAARLQVLTAAMCFGTTGTAQALGPDAATPATVGAARMVVGAALLVLVARRSSRCARKRPHAASSAHNGIGILVVGLALAAFQVTFFAAVDRTGVGVGTVVAIGSAPLFTGVLSALTGGARVGARWAQATGLAVVGVALLLLAGSSADVDGVGVALALGGGLAYATITVATKRLVDAGHEPERVLARAFVLAAVVLAPLLLTGDAGWIAAPGGMALALYLGAVPTALAYTLFGRGLVRLASPEVSTLALAEPLTAALLGVVVVGERPGALAYVGAVLVLAGLRVAVIEQPGSNRITDMAHDGPPWEPPLAGTEAEHLLAALDRLRTTFRWKADGLDDDALRARIASSSLTLGGLLKHLALVEDHSSTMRLDGSPIGEPWVSTWHGDDWVFTSASEQPADELYRLYDDAVARAQARFEAVIAAGGLDQPSAIEWSDGRHPSVRRMLFDLLEEYGRHVGHADLLREAIDGRVGEDPPDDWRPVS